ncbi:hypothetical protein CL634_00710, partial [bacterium]|nr:hypothetical protein [bacterium]
MQLLQAYLDTKRHRLFDSKLKVFDASIWLHAFSRSTIAIFIPILMLQLGYSIRAVIGYYFLYYLLDIPLTFFAGWLTRRIGARAVLIIGSFFSVAFFAVLYNLSANDFVLLGLLALFAALYDSLYWVSHLYLFMVFSKNDKNISRDASILAIMRHVAGILAPAFGAIILIFFNQKLLILISTSILIVSILPLFVVRSLKDKPPAVKLKRIKFFNQRHVSRDYISNGLFSVHRAAENVIWPI